MYNFFLIYIAVLMAMLTTQVVTFFVSKWYFSGPFWDNFADDDEPDKFRCYQCEELTSYLFDDARCKDCTMVQPATVDEVRGDA